MPGRMLEESCLAEDLAEVLSEFARTMVTDFPIQGILDHLVKRIVDILPVTAAGVTLIAAGLEPQYVAASDPSALRYEKLQTELGEGPCLAAYGSDEAISVPDLRVEDRFPEFAPAGAGSRADGGVHVPVAPRGRFGWARLTSTATPRGAVAGVDDRGADARGCRGGVSDQCSCRERSSGFLRPVT